MPESTGAIPVIEPYVVPAGADVPTSTVGWTPDPGRTVLLLHDLQYYFVNRFPVGQEPRTTLIDHIGQLLARARSLGIPVVYTAQPGGMSRAGRGLLNDFWGPGMGTDPASRDIVAELAPAPGDLVLTKLRYSAFHASPLAATLSTYGRDQIVLCGVFAHIGVLMTAADALAHDIQTFLVADAVADFTLAEHRWALEYAARRCAAVTTTHRILAELVTPDRRTAADAVRPGSPAGPGN